MPTMKLLFSPGWLAVEDAFNCMEEGVTDVHSFCDWAPSYVPRLQNMNAIADEAELKNRRLTSYL